VKVFQNPAGTINDKAHSFVSMAESQTVAAGILAVTLFANTGDLAELHHRMDRAGFNPEAFGQEFGANAESVPADFNEIQRYWAGRFFAWLGRSWDFWFRLTLGARCPRIKGAGFRD
jgi:hypothetical protein